MPLRASAPGLSTLPRRLTLQVPALRLAHPLPLRRDVRAAVFRIDHRHHLNLMYERQQADEEVLARAAADVHSQQVVTVRHLRHLEVLLEATGGRVAVLLLHSRSCGICKDVQLELEALAAESHSARAGVVFMAHDVMDEFDFPSGLARFYAVRSVPRLLFFVDGAVVKMVGMPDVRQVSRGTSLQVKGSLRAERLHLSTLLRELLFKNAPSARR
jgi:thiol-disulfide isomerase/thioredoxin